MSYPRLRRCIQGGFRAVFRSGPVEGWSTMNRSVLRLGLCVLLTALFCSMATFAYAQGGSSQTLTGTVVDASGAVIPGADVAAKHVGTGFVSSAVTNAEGIFSMASMQIGTYTV